MCLAGIMSSNYDVMLYCMLCYMLLCYDMQPVLCYAMLCYMVCYFKYYMAMFCFVLLCYATLLLISSFYNIIVSQTSGDFIMTIVLEMYSTECYQLAIL